MKTSPVRTALKLLTAASLITAGGAAGWLAAGPGNSDAADHGSTPHSADISPTGTNTTGSTGSAARPDKSISLPDLMRLAQGGGTRWERLHRVLDVISRLTPEESRAILSNPLNAFGTEEAHGLSSLFGMGEAGVITVPLLVMARWQQQNDAEFRAWADGLDRGGFFNFMPTFADMAILWGPARKRNLTEADFAGFSRERLSGVFSAGGFCGPAIFPAMAAMLKAQPDAADFSTDPDTIAALFSGNFDIPHALTLADGLPEALRHPMRAGILDAMARRNPAERLSLPMIRAEDIASAAGRAGIAEEMAHRGLALAQLALTDTPRAATLATHPMEASAAVMELAERDESMAVRWVTALPEDMRRRLASARDTATWPDTVRDALLRSFPGSQAPEQVRNARAAELAQHTPESIRAALGQYPAEEARVLAEAVLAERAAVSPTTVASTAAQLGYPDAAGAESVLTALARHHPQAVLGILEQQKNPQPSPELFLHLGRSDPAGTLTWLAAHRSVAASPVLAAETMQSWAHEAPGAAGEWINRSLQPGPVRDGAARGMALAIAGEDPEAARQWAITIADRGLREWTLESVQESAALAR